MPSVKSRIPIILIKDTAKYIQNVQNMCTCRSSSRWYRTSGLKLRLALGDPAARKRFGVLK